MLMGTHEHNLDAKGRVFIPAKIKEQLGDTFIMTKSMDSCIAIYSMEMWERYVEKLAALPTMKARGVQRFVFASAVEANADSQGRVLIPQALREYAGLVKEVVILGNLDHAEIWSADRYEKYNEEQDIPGMVNTLMDMGM